MKRSLTYLAFAAVAALSGLPSRAAPAQNPRKFCARVGNDDQLRKPPRALAAALHRAFGIGGSYALATSYYRCAGGKVMLCTVGANLPCGKANRSKVLAPAEDWCRDNPHSDFIPMAVTGHDTPYNWRCADGHAIAGAPVAKIDARGFFAENWKRLP